MIEAPLVILVPHRFALVIVEIVVYAIGLLHGGALRRLTTEVGKRMLATPILYGPYVPHSLVIFTIVRSRILL